MAWNQGGAGAPSAKSGHAGRVTLPKHSGLAKGLVAGLVVVIGAVGAFIWLTGDECGAKATAPSEKKPVKIAEGKVVEQHLELPEEKKPPAKPLPPQKVGELRDGYRMLCDGTLHKVSGIVTNSSPKISLADRTFKHSADVDLGHLLMVQPGDSLLGSSEGMYKGFGKQFAEAVAEPIVFDENDTPEQRELKEAVKEVREELQKRIAAGEDVEQIMTETREQLRELSLYREELQEQIRSLTSDDLTQKDYEDLVTAANQMLEDRGSKPLVLPVTLKGMLHVKKAQAEAVERERVQKEQEQQKLQEENK